jgi:hypothetical protein
VMEEEAEVTCQNCDFTFGIEVWRLEGVCEDGNYYCLTCIADLKCGCEKDEDGDSLHSWPDEEE